MDVLEVFAVLALAAVVALLVGRFPDTRKKYGEELDDALYKSSLQALWLFVALGAVALVVAWLLV